MKDAPGKRKVTLGLGHRIGPIKLVLFLPLLLSNVTDIERLSAFELFVYKDTVFI
jgi:hypothetical protein